MKFLSGIYLTYLQSRSSRRNLKILIRFLLLLIAVIFVYSTLFHVLMEAEERQYSWITGLYWTLTVMSTLGFGDITFTTDTGLVFSVIVLLTGTFFMLVMLPFLFIQFFYAPWMEAQSAAQDPVVEAADLPVTCLERRPVSWPCIVHVSRLSVPGPRRSS